MKRTSLSILVVLALVVCGVTAARAIDPLSSVSESRWHFNGLVAARIESNVDTWLLPAPEANPAMTEMFRLRDRQPAPKLVPWAGEFAGKYLISCVQALRE